MVDHGAGDAGNHEARVTWRRGSDAFLGGRYSRAHEWSFDGGAVVPASASPANVPPGTADAAGVDPEEAFIAALSSCHMLWFLGLAARAGLTVDSYDDEAVGTISRNDRGSPYFSRVALRPKIVFSGKTPTAAEITALHHQAHEKCHIANSVKAEVVIE
jgi:organic hydroperoxide reductase OsmC/OhrA